MEKTSEEILEESTELVEEETTELTEEENSTAEEGELLTESEEEFIGTVSGGDSLTEYESIASALSTLSEDNQMLLAELEESQTVATQTIMDKPLAEYTPTEGLLLILVVLALGTTIFRIVGGIIKI
ncbi:MAG: hypothetical protein IJX63_01815 [Lachnospiraceae bacterium]|nr:hypothetical protein [Lachnospiraceae bacterium]